MSNTAKIATIQSQIAEQAEQAPVAPVAERELAVLEREFRFSEGFTALAHAKGKAVDRVLKDLTEGASLGLTLAHVKGQARSKIITNLEQAEILRLAKLVQSGLYDAPIRTICKTYNVSLTVFSEDGKGVARAEWKKLAFLLSEERKALTPKGNPTSYAKQCLLALQKWNDVQAIADALRDAAAPVKHQAIAA